MDQLFAISFGSHLFASSNATSLAQIGNPAQDAFEIFFIWLAKFSFQIWLLIKQNKSVDSQEGGDCINQQCPIAKP